jgi:6-pyruvoyl-tetrahydropterin synthase
MPFTKFTNLDFDQIKTQIKSYLRANSDFKDFDFEGSNFSVLIDTLAYNTYITAFNSNMVVNESFLDSATIRENVVSLARNIGYVPRSRSAAKAQVSFTYNTTSTAPTATLTAGLVCVGTVENTNYLFSIPNDITTTIVNGVATFNNIDIFQGTFLRKQFVVDGSLDQRFLLDNSFIDSSTIVVKVADLNDSGVGREYSLASNILNIDSTSETYLIQEIKDERYELLFGDGYFGKKLENGDKITATYIITDGKDGNGPSSFSYAGRVVDDLGNAIVPTSDIVINTNISAQNGGDIESVDSIKYFAPRIYSSQYRAVTARDYEAIIQSVYPNTESVAVVGGEELDPPEFGQVVISIKPKNGDYVSDFDKQNILSKLKNYSLSGINQKIVDLKVLYVEIDSAVYFNSSQVSDVNDVKSKVMGILSTYSSSNINKFGGRFKYSKLAQIIDSSDISITSNITRVIIRRNLKALINQSAQYEICYGNKFKKNSGGFNIKSTGFTLANQSGTLYFTDVPDATGNMGTLSVVKESTTSDEFIVVVKSAGSIDYEKGEIMVNTLNITSTVASNDIIEIQACPDSNDVIGLKDLYLSFSVADSTINMIKDTISSGEQISGVGYKTTSSYLNGSLKRGDTSMAVASVSTTTTTSSTTTSTSSGTPSSGGGY